MAQSNSGSKCSKMCQAAGIVVGVVAFFILKGPQHWGFVTSLIGGVALGVIAYYALIYFVCSREISQSDTAEVAVSPAQMQRPQTAEANTEETVEVSETAPPEPLVKPSTLLKGEEELSAAKGEWRYDPEPAPIEPKPKKATSAKKSPAKSKSAKSLPVAEIDDEAVEAAGTGKKPRGLKAPRKGQADDLKLIEGVGPVLETLCNNMGIFHYDQIAKWGPAEIAYMNQNLPRFRGRVSRDKWVAQARLIGEVGIEAFLERAKTNNY